LPRFFRTLDAAGICVFLAGVDNSVVYICVHTAYLIVVLASCILRSGYVLNLLFCVILTVISYLLVIMTIR